MNPICAFSKSEVEDVCSKQHFRPQLFPVVSSIAILHDVRTYISIAVRIGLIAVAEMIAAAIFPTSTAGSLLFIQLLSK
jgi:hypothetical protein